MDRFNKTSEKAITIMMKMGYKEGSGLGKDQSGMLHPVEVQSQSSKRGFGHDSSGLGLGDKQNYQIWDGNDKISIEEELIWVQSVNSQFAHLTSNELSQWMVKGEPLTTLEKETLFVCEDVLRTLLKTKDEVFLTLDVVQLSRARTRANQFETIRSAFFMNRAALKMANIDAATNFMFTNIDHNPMHRTDVGAYYFADVCAGPGGFSEYVLWRKKWCFKGFGLTLKDVHDFKLNCSTCATDATFRAYYGANEDGNVCNPSNISDFARRVLHETNNEGVHFMMADGGFSVEGNEGIQEILSKQIYICQCLIALEIVRKHGHFVTKLFDIFTAFSVGLIFLMYQCFDKVAVLKPNSSRPANSERYFICYGLKDEAIVSEIRKYMRIIVEELWTMRDVNKDSLCDIIEIFPPQLIESDDTFYRYIHSQNTKLAQNQTIGLEKLAAFCKNTHLVDKRQDELRGKCLEYWRIPNRPRSQPEKFTTDDLLNQSISKPEFLYAQPCKVTNHKELERQVPDVTDWIYIPLASSKTNSCCHIFAGLNGSSAYKLQNYKWSKVKGLKLVKGTLLYGEIVTEYSSQIEASDKIEVKSLHVIDALRLGETSLADLNFKERCNLIKTYCQAINFETVSGSIRVRPKCFDRFVNINDGALINYSLIQDTHYSLLPTLGFDAFREYFIMNSVLLLKTDETHYFNTTYVLRVQIFIDKFDDEESPDAGLRYNRLLQYVKDKL